MEKKVAAETKKAENIIKAKITREEAILAKQREIDAENSNLLQRMMQILKRRSNRQQGLIRIPPTSIGQRG